MSRFSQTICLIAFLGVISSCSRRDADIEFVHRMEVTKASSDASKIKAIVDSLVPKYTNRLGSIPLSEVPDEIRTLPFFQRELSGEVRPEAFRIKDSSTIAWGFILGGGFQSFGIIVCPDERSKPDAPGTVVAWKDGVFFWADWKVRGVK